MNVVSKPQVSIKTLFLLILLVALSLRLIIVDQRFRKLLAETSSLGSVGGEAAELRTKLGYLVPEDTNSQYSVPIPPITGNSRSFRLYIPRIKGKRLLKLGMTSGSNSRYFLPRTNEKWPSVHQFELSDSEEQIITVSWLQSESGQSIIRIERTGFSPEDVQFKDAGFLESKDYDWPFLPLDVQATSVHSFDQSFNLWEASASKKSLSPEEFGVVSGFRLWIETKP